MAFMLKYLFEAHKQLRLFKMQISVIKSICIP